MKYFLFIGLIIFQSSIFAQSKTEVYLFDLAQSIDGWNLKSPINVSSNKGYDNQPSFSKDGQTLYYARTYDSQTDIATYDIQSGKTKRISKTFQGSEYSPTPTPKGQISSIRLDTSGFQRLYQYDHNGNYEILIDDLIVGYHVWLNKETVGLFVLGDINTLQVSNIKTQKSKILTDSIGRSLHQYPGTEDITYVNQKSQPWKIVRHNTTTEKVSELTSTLDQVQDFCFGPGESIIMGKDQKLFVWKEGAEWQPFADLSAFNLSGITRLAYSPQSRKLAVVINQ